MPAKKVLVADDDRQILRLLTLCLRREGYDIVNAVDGYQALQFAIDQRPDLLILDVNMPAGDGLSVQQRLRNNASMCVAPIIYLTGERSEKLIDYAKRMGAFAMLYKPFNTDLLLRTVRSALGDAAIVPLSSN